MEKKSNFTLFKTKVTGGMWDDISCTTHPISTTIFQQFQCCNFETCDLFY